MQKLGFHLLGNERVNDSANDAARDCQGHIVLTAPVAEETSRNYAQSDQEDDNKHRRDGKGFHVDHWLNSVSADTPF